jgi:hypothetical protein
MRGPTSQSRPALEALNFFLADAQGGFSPYLAIYLLSTLHRNPGQNFGSSRNELK